MPSFVQWNFTWSALTVPPPGSQHVRFNHSDPALVTALFFDIVNLDGVDVHDALMLIPVGNTIHVQDKADHTRSVRFTTTADPLDHTSWIEMTVAYVRDSGVPLQTEQPAALFIGTDIPPDPIPEPPTDETDTPDDGQPNRAPMYVYTPQPVLVSLQMAQQKLRVIFTANQPEIQNDLTAIVHQASDAVRNYLKSANDPTWTDTTAPPVVQAAVVTLASCWWTHKGDDNAPSDFDAAAWKTVERLLMQIRDPALA